MKALRFSREATQDLRQIRRQTRKNWGYFALEKFDTKLAARLLSLSVHPEIGPQHDELGSGFRSLSLTPFIIFYRISEAAVDIARVFDARPDYPKALARYLGDDKPH